MKAREGRVERGTFTYASGSVFRNTHLAVHYITVHWRVLLHKYMCAVTILKESQSRMARTEDALKQIFRFNGLYQLNNYTYTQLENGTFIRSAFVFHRRIL